MNLKDFKWAIVTGGSSGIGREFVLELSRKGLNVIATGRNEERLKQLADEVKEEFKTEIHTFVVDLSSPQEVERFIDEVSNFEIDLLVNNAGFGLYGEFVKLDLKEMESMIEVNVKALTVLSHHFAKQMVQRRRGGIINVSSIAGYMPLAYFNAYGATKAYVYNLSLALWAELRKYNVHVLCVAPGPTRTRFFERAFKDQSFRTFGKLMDPKQVALGAIEAFEKKKPVYVPAFKNKLISFTAKKLLPDRLLARFTAD
ncbi:short-chain dehydrogenase [Pseudothermotoga hypogea DSM 11164 = NBRC 106472]|uniref:Short-chain dehydrogenase n=2 Tax=Pseudothermotoga hypogea TaxID=57487 RepID=A0A0X1KRL8_9THEM|nr:SDR family oxidoreductase [Pseudothermotoga hypogea]AJC73824.1 short-chain dehydrogenase [Pseudothermotoga hypogea DSM 11164 = NBRC 106472]MBC7123561.1 SDR family oxidoreductase [Pseudothermotoga sp.]